MKKAVLFDLGNSLAEYFESCAYPELLPRCVEEVRACLESRGFPLGSGDERARAVAAEDWERADHRVRPLEGRLARIFRRPGIALSAPTLTDLCRAFMGPIFSLGRCYADSLPTLRELRRSRLKVGIVSNAPWGCPAFLCHEEALRLGLTELADEVVFCTDVGWRKPAPQIFASTWRRLGVEPAHCLFVGDHPEWDLAGPRAVGMEALLLDRKGVRRGVGEESVLHALDELWDKL